MTLKSPRPGELLVAIMNEPRDLAIAHEWNWYRNRPYQLSFFDNPKKN
jgi:hypothetical protein